MWTIKQPPEIIFGKNSAQDYSLPTNSLIITSKGAKSRGWLNYVGLETCNVFDQVEPNPSIDIAKKIISLYNNENFYHIIGIGGGSCLDVAKYCGFQMNKYKIMIPTTFGSGSEVTRISVLKIDGKKTSFHDDRIFADIAIIDPYFIEGTPKKIIKNSAIDACAQCTEAFDSKNSNPYTKFLCQKAFEFLEDGVLNDRPEKIVLGSVISGLGFGNSSTTLGHALSYAFSNEGIPHGHALAFTTTVAHDFNHSIFHKRFVNIIFKLKFDDIILKQNLEEAAELILTDKKHLDNNPNEITKNDVVILLHKINSGKTFEQFLN